MPKRIQSPSSINTYKQCPRKYYYQYILKLPTKPSIHLIRGSIAHSVLEDFFKITHLTIYDVQKKGFDNFALDLLRQYWKQHEKKLNELELTEQQLEFYLIETVQMIRNWVNHFTFKHDMLVEQGLSSMDAFLRLKPQSEVYYKDEELSVQGYMDAIHTDNKRIKILDYKTSKTAKISPEYYLQLGIYAVLYERKHGMRPHEVGIFFLKDTEHTIPVTEELIKNAQQEIEAIHINTSDFSEIQDYPQKPGPLCKWSSGQCDFYDKCFPQG